MARGGGPTQIRRLSRYDLHCLAVETPERPIHVGILAVVDGRALVDPGGRLRLADVRRDIDARVVDVPELRRVVYRPGPLAGGPVWVDDPGFLVEQHVGEVELPLPGDEAALLARIEGLMAGLLDRSRPLWRMWFVTGLPGRRIAVLVVLHHALADGQAAMRMVRRLLGPPLAGPAPDRGEAPVETPVPTWRALVRDNVRSGLTSALRLLRPASWRRTAKIANSLWQARSASRNTTRTSLNAPVGPRRRLVALRLELAEARRVARTQGSGVNDVVLSLVTGGVRALLEARGEPVNTLRPRAGIAVALFNPGHQHGAGNDIGTLHVPLPVGEPDPRLRLPLLAADRAAAMTSPLVAIEPAVRAWLRRLPGSRRAMERQRLVNLAETYLPGPPVAIEALGARVLELVPIAPLTGNLGLSFVALSYAGRVTIAVRADADRFPDLDVLAAAMERDWGALTTSITQSSVLPTQQDRPAPA